MFTPCSTATLKTLNVTFAMIENTLVYFLLRLNYSQHTSLVGVVNDRIREDPALTGDLNEYRVQAAWSLARFVTS